MALAAPAATAVPLRVVRRNILSNWTSYFVIAATSFVLAPLLVHKLGNAAYGTWTLVLSMTGYCSLLDLGIRSSVARFVSRYIARNDVALVNRTVNSAIAMLSCASLMTLLATAVMEFALSSFSLDANLRGAARVALFLAGANIALSLPMGVFGGVLTALERFDLSSAITIGATLTQTALTITVLKLEYGVVGLAAVGLIVNVAQYLTVFFCARWLYPGLQVSPRHASLEGWREMFGFSVYRFIWIIANQLIYYTDSVVIGARLGAAAITHYAIAGSLVNDGRYIVSTATDTLYPSASRLDSVDNHAGLQDLYIFTTKLALLLALPLCVGFTLLGGQFLTLWMGPEFARSAVILAVLTIPQFTSMPQFASVLILASMARHKVLAYIVFAEGLANLALSLFLVRRMGVIGVAWGTVIPHLVSTAVIIPLYTLRVLRISPWIYFVRGFLRPVLCAVPAAGLCYFFRAAVVSPSWAAFFAEVAAVCAVFGLLAYRFVFSSRERAALFARREATVAAGGAE